MNDYQDVDDFDGAIHAEEKTLVAERGAFERVRHHSPLQECMGDSPSDEKEKKKWIKRLEEVPRFCFRLKTEVLEDLEAVYGRIDENALVSAINKLGSTKYINPCGFVLGLLCTQGTKRLEKKRVLAVIEKLPDKVREKWGIAPPDVIRYARYWSAFL